MNGFSGAGDGALMLDDQSSRPMARRLLDWADTLPTFAADVVTAADITRPHFYTETTARPDQVRLVRAQVTEWTRQLKISEFQGNDIMLATDEAVANAVDHAYPERPGTLSVFAAAQELGSVRIVVADHGTWRPPPADPGYRGRGLTMMRRLARVFRLMHGPHGTTVVMGWPLAA